MLLNRTNSTLILEDGSIFSGYSFGSRKSVAGEVVFNTGMVGYPESLTDPSYKGQILVLTYPLIGNYGVPEHECVQGFSPHLESETVQIQGLVVTDYSFHYSHWSGTLTLDEWLRRHEVPGLYGVDTRMLTKHLRDKGSMLGKMEGPGDHVDLYDPNSKNLVQLVSVEYVKRYHGQNGKVVVVIDCGCKNSIIRNLLARGVSVIRVPWDYDFFGEDFDGVVISNGPGDPKMCGTTISHVRKLIDTGRPIFGICLGSQILALAAGANTYKLKFGHRGQNQPCVELGTHRCYITSQNHGYAVRTETLPKDWEPWFINANDGTNEGIRHRTRPFISVQFHPEGAPGSLDTGYLFDEFVSLL